MISFNKYVYMNRVSKNLMGGREGRRKEVVIKKA
jgi:hypothetical protein